MNFYYDLSLHTDSGSVFSRGSDPGQHHLGPTLFGVMEHSMESGHGKKKYFCIFEFKSLHTIQIVCRENFKYEVTPTDGSARDIPVYNPPQKSKCGPNYLNADR